MKKYIPIQPKTHQNPETAHNIAKPHLSNQLKLLCVTQLKRGLKILVHYGLNQNQVIYDIPLSHFCKYLVPDQQTQCVFQQGGRDIYKSVIKGYKLIYKPHKSSFPDASVATQGIFSSSNFPKQMRLLKLNPFPQGASHMSYLDHIRVFKDFSKKINKKL